MLAGCGSSSKSSSSSSASTGQAASAPASSAGSTALVTTASNAKLGGTILVDAHGMTLYSLSAERAGKFICTGSACLQVWHPLTAASGSAPSSNVGSLATVRRADGSEQVTYKGMPLYTFALDRAPGDVRGQGIKDVGTWKAVTAQTGTSGAPAATTTSSAPPTTSTPKSESHGAYGY
jgi:predicted lipoprotein with Yx(FWY)xxD motif